MVKGKKQETPLYLWSVEVAYDHSHLDEEGRALKALEATLPDANIRANPPGSVEIFLSVIESTPDRAVQRAVAEVQNATIAAGLGRSLPYRMKVELLEDSDLDLHHIRVPDPLGLSEIASILGVTRQRAWQITKSADFPAPAAVLASGPVWHKGDVARFLISPRRRGRPSRTATAGQSLRKFLANNAVMHSHTISEDSSGHVYLWICVPGPRGVPYILSKSQAESLISHFFDPGVASRAMSQRNSGKPSKLHADEIVAFMQSQGWERRQGFLRGVTAGPGSQGA
jgi:hypothetical protein